MNISTNLIFLNENEESSICKKVFQEGTEALKKSVKIEPYGISLRETFGLCVLSSLRANIEPDKRWAFTTESQISDDGAVVSLDGNKIQYCELVEQIYLPGEYIDRSDSHSMNDHILHQISTKKSKGFQYSKDTSLFILNDIYSTDRSDYFEWQDFAKRFFTDLPFLHLYFLGLTEHTQTHNSYYLFSFTNQLHRQHLNGEFRFNLNARGIFDFECTQTINLLEPKSENSN